MLLLRTAAAPKLAIDPFNVWVVPPIAWRCRLQLHRSALVFFGENSGSFMAADADNGKVLWEFPANQTWRPSPMTYMFDNRKYVAIAAGTSIIAFALPE